VAGIVAGFASVIVAVPGFASLWMLQGPQMQPGTRYATYDPELHFFGLSSSPDAARWISFSAAPILLVVAIVLIPPFARRSALPKRQNGG